MKILLVGFSLVFFVSCNNADKHKQKTHENISVLSARQYDSMYSNIFSHISEEKFIPRSYNDSVNKIKYVGAYDWTSGFYPGALWYLYTLTKNHSWKKRAIIYTEKLDTIQYWRGNHDIGFMIECSYGNALKHLKSSKYDSVIVQTSKSLVTRFIPKAGVLKSWDWSKKWDCPVIIDNMMNLELLFHATKITNDSTYYNIAVTHADTTIKNHFRDDYSSYHVVDYNSNTGDVIQKNTHQGLSDNSAWARGQSWALYGYTMCYRETKMLRYLKQAKRVANYIINHPNLPSDKVPYWDYNAPSGLETPRDASAAALMASALYELSSYVDTDEKHQFIKVADQIMKSLSTPAYFAEIGTNGGFLLLHSVGNKPHGVEVDQPLNYADYYFLEALIRRQALKNELSS